MLIKMPACVTELSDGTAESSRGLACLQVTNATVLSAAQVRRRETEESARLSDFPSLGASQQRPPAHPLPAPPSGESHSQLTLPSHSQCLKTGKYFEVLVKNHNHVEHRLAVGVAVQLWEQWRTIRSC